MKDLLSTPPPNDGDCPARVYGAPRDSTFKVVFFKSGMVDGERSAVMDEIAMTVDQSCEAINGLHEAIEAGNEGVRPKTSLKRWCGSRRKSVKDGSACRHNRAEDGI